MAEVSEVVSSAEEHSENVCTVSISVKGRISLRPFNKSAKTMGTVEELVSAINGGEISSLCLKMADWNISSENSSISPAEVIHSTVALPRLHSLDLTGVQLPKGSFDSNLEFTGLDNLHTLILDDTNLRLLHPTIGKLQRLKTLSLQYNRLYDLPVTVRLLKHLKCLRITGNLFRSLPGALFHMYSLETLEGLNENLLERYPGWKAEPIPIATVPPLIKPNPPREVVDDLTTMAIRCGVGMNVWCIPLPDHVRGKIVKLTVRHDLCENCYSPVKKVMADQETDGHLIKVCMTQFKQYGMVPFMFLACSVTCKDAVVERFYAIWRNQKKKHSNEKLDVVVLKEEYSRPVRIKRGDVKVLPGNTEQENGYKCTVS